VEGIGLSRVRTFLAVDLTGEVRREAEAAIARLARCTTDVSWVAAHNLHLTLKFLGDVDDTQLYAACRAATEATAGLSRFRAECRGVGAFPHLAAPRTIWFGVQDPHSLIASLQRSVEDAMRDLGFPRELRPYRPHVTLGRVRGHRDRDDRLQQELGLLGDLALGWIEVDECVVYGSDLTPAGPVYTPLGRAPLSG
jgi:2'-5' RNA ligase